MGLAAFSGDLAGFAAGSASPGARDRLVMAVLRLCRAARGTPMPVDAVEQVSALTHDLLAFSDPESRLRLAEDLAEAAWPGDNLIWALATGPIDSATPILRSSPVLDQADLMGLINVTGPEHHTELARRQGLPEAVVDMLIASNDPAVLTALAENRDIPLTLSQLELLVTRARTVAALRKPLACHDRLTESQAYGLYAWCEDPQRQLLVQRFGLQTRALDAALASANPSVTDDQDTTGALVVKMHSAGQLTTSFLLRALMDRRLSVFLQGMARLGDFSLPSLQAAIGAASAEPLALACRAVGMDRTVFPQVLASIRQLNGERPGGSPDDGERVDQAFGGISPLWAGRAFRMLEPFSPSDGIAFRDNKGSNSVV